MYCSEVPSAGRPLMRLGLASLSVGDPRLWPTTVSRIWARRPRANASNGSICSSGVNAGQTLAHEHRCREGEGAQRRV